MHNIDLSAEPAKTLEAIQQRLNYISIRLHKKKDGTIFPVEITSNFFQLTDRMKVLTCIIRDITKRVAQEEKLIELSFRDRLTGCYSRHFYEEEVARLIKGRHHPIGVIYVDIDGLSSINNTFGHAAGDKVIRTTAELLKTDFRDEDSISRIGGDEFVILLPETDEKTVIKIVDRIRKSLDKYNKSKPKINLSFSIGHSIAFEGKQLSSAIKLADKSMYKEKKAKKALI